MTDDEHAAALRRFDTESETAPGDRLVDSAERARDDDWSLRSALVRFAQPEPTRASAVLELIRRTDGVLRPDRRLPDVTSAAEDDAYVAALASALVLDDLADTLVTWARDPVTGSNPPVDAVDAACRRSFDLLAGGDVPRETGPPGRGRR